VAGLAALLDALAWPAVALAALLLFRAPLRTLIESFARRGFKLSAKGVSVEASALAFNTELEAAAKALADTSAGGSGPVPLAEAVLAAGRADYLRLDLGPLDAPRWLTSRLFLLTALLEREGAARAVVFTGGDGAFLGVAAPGAIRRALGSTTPAFERALAGALADAAHAQFEGFAGRDGMSPAARNAVVRGFLVAAGVPRQGTRSYVVLFQAPPPAEAGWRHLPAGPQRAAALWELAAPVLPSRDALRGLLGEGLHTASLPVAPGGRLTAAQLAEVARSAAPFIALVDEAGAFRGLTERAALLARAVEAATAE
jgi:hypothetical protein